MGQGQTGVLLRDEGYACSAPTVGWILRKLEERGILKEPVPNHVSARKRQCPYAIRKPREYATKEPGDTVEIDTLCGESIKDTHQGILRSNGYHL